MDTIPIPPALSSGAPEKIPPLQNGDRLTRAEFERRYDAMPHLKKAELIEGVVYMPSPAGHAQHGEPLFDLVGWLGRYCAFTPAVEGSLHTSLRLDLDNEPQPDVVLMVVPAHRGQAKIDNEGFIVGPPELIAEVAASSVSYDLHVKLNAYRRNGVLEYVVWRVLDGAIDWFVLRQGAYERLAPDAAGVYRSEVFPGLWLDAAALIRGDRAAVVRTLQEGLASDEHADFVSRLERATARQQKEGAV
jgi:Uma2 family endonuclease